MCEHCNYNNCLKSQNWYGNKYNYHGSSRTLDVEVNGDKKLGAEHEFGNMS